MPSVFRIWRVRPKGPILGGSNPFSKLDSLIAWRRHLISSVGQRANEDQKAARNPEKRILSKILAEVKQTKVNEGYPRGPRGFPGPPSFFESMKTSVVSTSKVCIHSSWCMGTSPPSAPRRCPCVSQYKATYEARFTALEDSFSLTGVLICHPGESIIF